jgi:hypothetical protein
VRQALTEEVRRFVLYAQMVIEPTGLLTLGAVVGFIVVV